MLHKFEYPNSGPDSDHLENKRVPNLAATEGERV